MNNYTPDSGKSQEHELFKKLIRKKRENRHVIDFFDSIKEHERADNIRHCGDHVGITTIDGVAKIVKADFCRERLCYVCAWRRQARFMAQMFPVIDLLCKQGFQFLFATLTIKNKSYTELQSAIDALMMGYEKLRHRRKVARGWAGMVRSVELTYNSKQDSFHPHIHILIAVRPEYFNRNDLYISQVELAEIWRDCLGVEYIPVVDIRKVDSTDKACVETLKYSLKPGKAKQAFDAFFYILICFFMINNLIYFTKFFSSYCNSVFQNNFCFH